MGKHHVVRIVIPTKIQMITAKITAIKSGRNGGVPFAFAKAPDLQSDYNPDGAVTFTIVPAIWRGRELPQVGETVVLGQLKKKVKPEWPAPRWRALEAKPMHGTLRARPQQSLLTPPKPQLPERDGRGLWTRLLGALRPRSRMGAHVLAK